jgi:hypothetical protein
MYGSAISRLRHNCLSFTLLNLLWKVKRYVKGKATPVTGREGPLVCDTSRLPHFLDNRLTDGGEVVSLTCRPHFISRKIPGTHLC